VLADIDAGKDVEANQRELRLTMEFAGLQGVEPPRDSPTSFTKPSHARFCNPLLAGRVPDHRRVRHDRPLQHPGSAAPTNWTHRLPYTVQELTKTQCSFNRRRCSPASLSKPAVC